MLPQCGGIVIWNANPEGAKAGGNRWSLSGAHQRRIFGRSLNPSIRKVAGPARCNTLCIAFADFPTRRTRLRAASPPVSSPVSRHFSGCIFWWPQGSHGSFAEI